MPIYEYELIDDDCMICTGRFSVIQGLDDEPMKFCPTCGLPCKKVVSKVSIDTKGKKTAAKAAEKGFTTWKKAGKGQWEKVDGPGVDAIVGSDADIKAVEAEKKVGKLDLDKKD